MPIPSESDNRQWKIMSDASIRCENRNGNSASRLYAVEFVTPICNYNDIETVQELVRQLRASGARVNSSCGIHVRHQRKICCTRPCRSMYQDRTTVRKWIHAFLTKSMQGDR